MIRPFDLRDVALIRRLSEQGVAMHSKTALADGVSPLRDALLNIVSSDFPTFVYKSDDGGSDGFVQLHQEKGIENRAHLLYISPNITTKSHQIETVWLSLLDQAVQEAGRRGLHTVVAEVDETADALPILREAGFAVYTRQDIYQLMTLPDKPTSSMPALTMRQKSDDWDVQLLYSNIVPRLVQIVNPNPPTSRAGSWVLRENGELTAYIHLHVGSAATWMRLFMHPDAISSADELLTAVIQLIPGKETHPVYASVRRYQGWQQAPLERIGFARICSQAVMARHTTRQVKKQTGSLRQTRDGKRVSASAPLSGEHANFATEPDGTNNSLTGTSQKSTSS